MKKTLRISFNGKSYDVVAELIGDDAPSNQPAATSMMAAAPAASAAAPTTVSAPRPAPAAGGAGEIASPLAGKVVTISVAIGAAVKTGQPVITLEAMKMNTIISATADGTVAAVHVSPGDGVEEGQLLITLR